MKKEDITLVNIYDLKRGAPKHKKYKQKNILIALTTLKFEIFYLPKSTIKKVKTKANKWTKAFAQT